MVDLGNGGNVLDWSCVKSRAIQCDSPNGEDEEERFERTKLIIIDQASLLVSGSSHELVGTSIRRNPPIQDTFKNNAPTKRRKLLMRPFTDSLTKVPKSLLCSDAKVLHSKVKIPEQADNHT